MINGGGSTCSNHVGLESMILSKNKTFEILDQQSIFQEHILTRQEHLALWGFYYWDIPNQGIYVI